MMTLMINSALELGLGACFSEIQNFPPRTRQVIKLAGKIALHALSCLKQILKHDLVPGLPYIQLLPLFLRPTHPVSPFPYPRGEPPIQRYVSYLSKVRPKQPLSFIQV